mgnify:CR=1 FL=1
MIRLFAALLVLFIPRVAIAGELTLAVASNFLTTAEELVSRFEASTGHKVTLTHGATGQLYAQIEAGAPFDVFLAADAHRPDLLRQAGLTRRVGTYALGRLVLVSTAEVTRKSAPEVMSGSTVALADPTVAPYGLASTAAMERLKLDTATFRPVLVANVGQVATIFATGNAEFAFVAASQLPLLSSPFVLDLKGLHKPLVHDAALLVQAEDNDAALAFWDWLFTDESRTVIELSGYDLVE